MLRFIIAKVIVPFGVVLTLFVATCLDALDYIFNDDDQ